VENCVLATREMRQRQTGFNIKEMIDLVLDEFGFTNDNNYFVTDSARDMITAFDDKVLVVDDILVVVIISILLLSIH
jgi:hypothetical protein